MRTSEPPRVLHVLRSLDWGGVEVWLLHVMRNMPRSSWRPEFLLHVTEPGVYEQEMRSLGAVLHYCTETRRPLRYTRELRRILRETGPYDVVHSHVHLYSGIVLRAARLEGVPVRIAHSHTAKRETTSSRRIYGRVMQRFIHANATHCLAVSPDAADSLFGHRWSKDSRVIIHEYGLDYSPFARLPERALAKAQIGLPAGRIVIGHVGRFAPEKNHAFVVEIFAELLRAGVDAHLLLVGGGSLEQRVRRQIDALGIAQRCTLAGAHTDSARFIAAMDVMLLPSLREGLPVVTLEAQAAGVPVLASEAVPRDMIVVPGLLHLRALADGAAAWANTSREILAAAPALDRATTAAALAASRYGIARSVRDLARIYEAPQ